MTADALTTEKNNESNERDRSAFLRAHAEVCALVQSFQAHRDNYLAPRYQEAEVRVDFINKFLVALGWDVHHDRQRNPYAQEVRVERGMQMHGRRKKADYALFIAPEFNQERLFIEAKKPSEPLANQDHYFQAIRYAWNKQHPLVVLTNFVELHVIDCRIKPHIDTVLGQTLLRFALEDYLDADKFAELYYLLARDHVARGALEQYAATHHAHTNRQLKAAGVVAQKLDESFLVDLDLYRERLARAFKREDPQLDGEVLTETTQRTLDRLVFIRFLEDKFILGEPIIEQFGKRKSKSAWEDFLVHSAKLNRTYNGIVFKPLAHLDQALFRDEHGVFADICAELSNPRSPYDFSEISIHILGSIYERFLGKVIRTTPKLAKVEEKEEVRKAGGVYYTPDYIVRYIVRHTVGELIEGKTPEAIAALRFADIACGSGSFLLGVFDALINYHRRWYNEHPVQAKRHGCYQTERDGRWHLPLRMKREILLNNVYGVDIDAQAVEVAQLSLSLKLLEDETTASARQYSLDHHEPLLPSLAKNIVCGNSLISRDVLNQELFATDTARKLNAMNFEYAFPSIMRAGGFDVIVGNPPYVRQESLGNVFKDYAAKHYATYAATADLYTYFIERAHRKLKPGGLFGYIVSNKFIRASYGRKLRQFLATQSSLRQIVDMGELPVFAQAATFPAIVITQNQATTQQRFTHAAIKRLDTSKFAEEVARAAKTLSDAALQGENWSLVANESVRLLDKIKAAGVPLGKYVERKVYFGIKTGLNEAFVVDTVTRKQLVTAHAACANLIKPFALGDDVRHYEIRDQGRFLILIPNGWTRQQAGRHAGWPWFKKHYPALAAHLEPFQKRAEKRQDKGEFWWELRPCDYYPVFEQPKIVYPDIAKESRFTLDSQGWYFGNTCYLIAQADKRLLAILNSKLVFWYFKHIASVLGDADKGGRMRWFRQDVMRIPIPPCDLGLREHKQRHDQIVTLVDRLLAAKRQLADASTDKDRNYYSHDCHALDQELNTLVYQLYDLNDEEIAWIEGRV